ncbi:hypothetical protein NPIL_216501 [Nephila pilipes]|uniref:Uncharacterized protein n=1 Tax=Nephila pilipes TaxID=299642 RepID=A0A8X6TCA9_NEPPI|nr:hypothetical protein NPIL_216501 [Nephila pilipes]
MLFNSLYVKSYVSKSMPLASKLESVEETGVHGQFGGIEKNEYHNKNRANNIESVPTTYWTDSESKSEDRRLIAESLNHVDLPSRRCSAEELLKSRWLEGLRWFAFPPKERVATEVVPMTAHTIIRQ